MAGLASLLQQFYSISIRQILGLEHLAVKWWVGNFNDVAAKEGPINMLKKDKNGEEKKSLHVKRSNEETNEDKKKKVRKERVLP